MVILYKKELAFANSFLYNKLLNWGNRMGLGNPIYIITHILEINTLVTENLEKFICLSIN